MENFSEAMDLFCWAEAVWIRASIPGRRKEYPTTYLNVRIKSVETSPTSFLGYMVVFRLQALSLRSLA
jgi:hypothetical protein